MAPLLALNLALCRCHHYADGCLNVLGCHPTFLICPFLICLVDAYVGLCNSIRMPDISTPQDMIVYSAARPGSHQFSGDMV